MSRVSLVSFLLFLVPGAFGLSLPVSLRAQVVDVPDTPRERWEYFYRQRAYPFPEIPGGVLQKARQEMGAIGPAVLKAPPPIRGTVWAPLGPERIPHAGTSTGRLTAIAIHPQDSDIIYVGGAQGGVWKTVNGGASWVPLTDDQCSLAMGSIAIDPVDPRIVYAGTGEQHFSGTSYYGCGLLRSEDGGETWTHLGASEFVRDGRSNARISRVNVDPATAGEVATTTVLVASDFGLFRSTDGGESWRLVLDGIATDLVRNPSDPRILYAAIRRSGVYRSTDGGVHWALLPEGFPAAYVSRINLALAPSAPETVFASVQHRTESDLLGIWKTTNGGESWTQLPATNASCGRQCWYNMTIAVSPVDPDLVYFGGISLYRSINGGSSFEDVRNGIHVDQHYLAFDPQDPSVVYVGNDGGVYRSNDRGASWTSLNTNLALTQFYPGVSLHPWDPVVSLGGTQDNGTLVTSGGREYTRVVGGDGGFTAIDFLEPRIRYGETQWKVDASYSGPRRSDGGAFERKVNGIDLSEQALFIPPLVMDPVDPRRLYFGTVRLYRTSDRGENWTPLTATFSGRISAIAPSAADPAVVYLGTQRGEVHRTDDGGEIWHLATSGLPDRFIKDIAVHPGDAGTAFLTVSGFGSGHVFRTGNRGLSWDDISGNLPDVPVNAIVLDPVRDSTLFIGTDLGVFVSSDGGASWLPMTEGLPNVAVLDLVYNPSTGILMAATHGRGLFTLALDRPLTLAVLPGFRADSVLIGAFEPSVDSATVLLTGTDGAGAAWSAEHGSSWLSLAEAEGRGSARLRWTRDLSDLGPGTFVDTIRVSAAGAVDSPSEVLDTVVVLAPRTMSVEPSVRTRRAVVGSTATLRDEATITLTGERAEISPWEATHSGVPWARILTPRSVGSGVVRWEKDPEGLAEGIYVDTVRVTSVGAEGTPALIVDSLILQAAPVGLDPATRRGYAVAGTSDVVGDSARVVLSGADSEGVGWTAWSGASWNTLTQGAGSGTGFLRWVRDPAGLGLGTYADTIRLETTAGDTASLVDTFTLTAPWIPRGCAAGHLLGQACLVDFQLRFLDLEGNADGVYNLGDFLAELERNRTDASPGGEP